MTDAATVAWQRELKGVPAQLEARFPGCWGRFEFLGEIDSTNRRLLAAPDLQPHGFHVCVAREQTAGHGRRGRAWASVADSSLTFSIARALRMGEIPDPSLSLAIGVGLARGLSRCGLEGFFLKWPNDLVTRDGAKLAGVLVEARGKHGEYPAALVVGIGLNCKGAGVLCVDRPIADLSDLSGPSDLAPRELLQAIIEEVVMAWRGFDQGGLSSFGDDLTRIDFLRGRDVVVIDTGDEGRVAGIDPRDGALLLEQGERTKRLYSGEVSVRVLRRD